MDKRETSATKYSGALESIGGIAGGMTLVYLILQGWVTTSVASALVVAIVVGVIISAYFWRIRDYSPWAILMGWMTVAIVILILFVAFPRQMIIEGHVRNTLETPLPRVDITLRDYRNAAYHTTTGTDGSFLFKDVPTGRFVIESPRVSSISVETTGILIRRQVVDLIEYQEAALPSPSPTVLITSTTPVTSSVVLTSTGDIPGVGSTIVSDRDGATLVFIPGGVTPVGGRVDDTMAKNDEKPIHDVPITNFWMDKFEVSNRQYRSCVQAGGCPLPDSTFYMDQAQYDDWPVAYLKWEAAEAYCSWAGRRLPTEAEWERAARGDTVRIYPWGDASPMNISANICDQRCPTTANQTKTIDDGFERYAPVTAFPSGESPFGTRNMAGNVSEWVSDWYSASYYLDPESAMANPPGPAVGTRKVAKGGSWASIPAVVRISNRQSWSLNIDRLDSALLGVRCAMDFIND